MFQPFFQFFLIALIVTGISACTGGGGQSAPTGAANVSTGAGASLPNASPGAPNLNPGGAYSLTNLRGNWMAQYANLTGPNTSNNGTWKDLTGNGFDGTLSDTTHGSWTGAGTSSSPYSLFLDGNTHADFGSSVLSSHSKMMFTSWINPASASTTGQTILGNSADGTGNGFTVRQSKSQPGRIEYVIGKSCQDTVLSLNPVSYWRLGESSGAIANDISNSHLNGSYSGGVTLGASGALGGDSSTAASFDSLTGSMSVADNSHLNPASMTVSARVNLNSLTSATTCGSTPANLQYLIFKRNSRTANFEGYTVFLSNGNFCFGLASSGGVQSAICSSTRASVGTWYHVAASFDGSSTMNLYVNGILEATGSHNYPLDYGTRPLFIGRSGECGGPGQGTWDSLLNGKVNEVALFNSALSSDQVSTLYNAGIGTYGGSCLSKSLFSNSTWAFIAGSFDGDEASFYVNGRQECSVTGISASINSPTSNLIAGGTASNANGWRGSISDIKIYGASEGSEINSADDIKTNFNISADTYRINLIGNIVTDGLVLNLDAANATTVAPYPNGCATAGLAWSDLSASSLTGNLIGFSSCNSLSGWNGDGGQTVNGTAGPYRLAFDGTDDYVNTALDPSTLGQTFTISAWVYPTATGNYRGIAGGHVDAHQGLVFGQWNTGYWQFGYGDGTNWPTGVATVLTPNAWTYVTAVFKGSDYVKLYLNGALTRTQPQTTDIVHTTGFWIGRAYNAPGRYFQGGIGEFAVYNRVLSPTEISQNCTALKSRFNDAICN